MAMRAAGYDRNGNPIKTTAAKPKPPAEDPWLKEAREKTEQAKQKLINAAKMLGKIAMDELGITATLDCLTTGDLGACGETLINVASSFVGGLAGKIASKYGAPWKWKKAYELGQKIWNLGKELVDGVTTWFKNLKLRVPAARGAPVRRATVVQESVARADLDPPRWSCSGQSRRGGRPGPPGRMAQADTSAVP